MLNETRARSIANEKLAALGTTYHPFIPIADIDNILSSVGFNEMEPAIFCGRDGRSHEPVSGKSWLSMTWYKMPSGRYEIVAYVS